MSDALPALCPPDAAFPQAPEILRLSRMSDAADHSLVAAARAGDQAAFSELVAHYKGRIFSMASRYARNHHELEDLAQEIFIRTWRGLTGFRGDAPFEHWLMRLAVRTCYDFLRRNRGRREREVSRDAMLLEGRLNVETAGGPEPAEDSEALLLLRRAIVLLNPKERLVITLLELEERPVREVAALTGWTETNVKVRAFRARQNLKKCIERLRSAPGGGVD